MSIWHLVLTFLLAGPAPDTVPPPDRAEEARQRQHDFERFRRRRLPWTWGGSGPPCDERIGRFCFWFDEEDDEPWEPPEEPEEVRRRRGRLVAFLDSAAAAVPESDWIAGQRVRYLIEEGRVGEAVRAARSCGASGAWCAALTGRALHAAGDYAAADSAFAAALGAMPPEEGCRWRDVGVLYRGDPVPGYDDLACGERGATEAALWRLADPLYLVPGNDRRTEHFARRVQDRLQEDAASPFGDPWGDDLREIVLRYGWPVGFEQAPPNVYGSGRRPVVAHFSSLQLRFLPPGEVFRDPGPPAPKGWDLEPHHPRSGHAPPYLQEEMGSLDVQVARFRRGDSVELVAAYRMPEELEAGGPVHAALFVVELRGAAATGTAPRPVDRGSGRAGVLRGRAPAGQAVLSVEAYAPADSLAARARYGSRLPRAPEDGAALSDLLLLAPAGDTLPDALAAVAGRARPGTTLHPGDRLGLYWEVYGVGPGARPLRTAVRLVRTDAGFFRAVGEFLGLAGEREPAVAVSWTEVTAPGASRHGRSLVLVLPEEAGEGEYRLEVSVTPEGGAALSAGRDLRVERRPE